MKKYNTDNLKEQLQFDVYYTGSLPLAYMFPHLGHLLQEDILLDDKLILVGYMLFYYCSNNELEILSPEQWAQDKRSCYKVGTYEDHVRTSARNIAWSNTHYPGFIESYLNSDIKKVTIINR